MAYEVGFMVG